MRIFPLLLFPLLQDNKRRRNVSAFADLVGSPVAAAVQGEFPANGRIRLTCVTPGGSPQIAGQTYTGLTAGQTVLRTDVERGEKFIIDAGSRLDVDVGLGVWKKIAGGS